MKIKKWATALLCIVLAFSMTGCLGNFYDTVATIDGTEVSSGLYLIAQMTYYNEAKYTVEDTEADPLKQTIDGQKVKDWIAEKTEDALRRYVYVRRACREYGLTLDSEGQTNLEQMMEYWPYLEKSYADNGISEETMQRYYTFEELNRILFNYMYSEQGELYVPDAELKREYSDKFVHVEYFIIPLSSSNEEFTVDIPATQAAVEALLPELEGGRAMDEVVREELPDIYKTYLDRDLAPDAAAESITTAHLPYQPSNYDTYSEEFMQTLQDQYIGDYGVHNLGSTLMLYRKIATFANNDEYLNSRATVLQSLKNDEYLDYIRTIYNEYSINWVFGARWFFRPEKIDW